MPSEGSPHTEEIPPIFSYDATIWKEYGMVAGLDEAGRGPLAGPVVASAIILPQGLIIRGLKDSKKTTEKERKRLFWEIVRSAVAVGVGIVGADTIDRINILQSTKEAMKSALDDLGERPAFLLIDALTLGDVQIEQRALIKGESVSASIAAASIVAKVVRDEIMTDYHEKFPAYNFRVHKGYSTKEHMECIQTHGPCPIHRKSFRKVMDVRLPLNDDYS
jgi:ribonuclease HII